jgi:hypothetical protein
MEACFAGPALLQHMLAFEVALAHAQAELGIIPAASAAAIARAARAERFDLAALIAATRDSATPAIPLARALQHHCDAHAMARAPHGPVQPPAPRELPTASQLVRALVARRLHVGADGTLPPGLFASMQAGA